MKLRQKILKSVHKEIVTAVVWTPDNELLSVSDDKSIQKWDITGEPIGYSISIDTYGVSMSWSPSFNKQACDLFALGCSDGTIRFLTKAGREDKKIDAHDGATIKVLWNYEGTALCSSGEDGDVKIWSRNGNLRSTLMQNSVPVYSIAWSADNEQIAAGVGRDIICKALQAGRKPTKWAAHMGIVTALDWSAVQDIIVSGSEDRSYRVWDTYGRLLFQGEPLNNVVTAVAWAPAGDVFCVGSFNMLRICDKSGWTRCSEQTNCGSIMSFAWSGDGTQVVCGGGNGKIIYAQLNGQVIQWDSYEAVLMDSHKILFSDIGGGLKEELEFCRERVVNMEMCYGHLIVATSAQCFIYATSNLNTPHIIDMRAPVSLLVLCERHFLTVDSVCGIQIWSYEGRLVSSPRLPSVHLGLLNRHNVALSADVLAVLDRTDGRTVLLCDANTGRIMSEYTISHDFQVASLGLNQSGKNLDDRLLSLVDKNSDLWIYVIGDTRKKGGKYRRHKLHTQVDSFAWNDSCSLLTAFADGRIITWYHPAAAHLDKDLMELARDYRDAPEYNKSPTVVSFLGTKIFLRRTDGITFIDSISPFPAMIHSCASKALWKECLRLCRLANEDSIWAVCATLAIQAHNLDVAEEALAALRAVDKLEYLSYIREIPTEEGRNAELALYRKCPDEAEAILLQSYPLPIYRAIKLNLRLFRFSRALELAIMYNSHIDTVLAYRQRYLKTFGSKQETDKTFLQYAQQVTIDWNSILANEKKELENEKNIAGLQKTHK